MNYQLTKRSVLDSNLYVISVGYCGIQYLLHYAQRLGYTCGIYGWNADIYQFEDNVAICSEFKEKHEVKKEKVQKLLAEYIEKCVAILREKRKENKQ